MKFATYTTTSNDGTSIGYRQIGTGPRLIVCHGGGRISQNYEKLALALSDKFTVYIPDRRGRGLSGPEGNEYNMIKASQDLAAVIKATSAEFIFGHSAGAMIALETMLSCSVKKIALYEPPVSINGSFPLSWLTDFEKAVQAGYPKKAMAISLKGLNVVEGIGKMPLSMILLFINAISLMERKKERGTRMLDLIPTLAADIKMAYELDSKYERYHDLRIPLSLMYGSKSPEYFASGVKELSNIIAGSETKVFDGFDHYSPEEKVRELSDHLKLFLTA